MLRPFRVVVAVAFLSGAVFAANPNGWITYNSREGGFTIDLPANPNITRSLTHQSRRGIVKIFLVGCEADGAGYLAFRIDIPINIPRGIEDEILDAERDHFAQMWNGQVVTEKKVRAQGNPGRDFTVRGRPKNIGDSTIRVREYLAGHSIFAVAVLSAPNRELPEDAGRFLGSLALGEARTRASGTPEPEPTGTELAGWGLAIDPDRDCQFTPAGDRNITIQVPGRLHDLFFDGGPTNSPRVMREVVGDFVLTVRVAGDFRPSPPSTNPKTIPYHGGGIFLWSDSDNNIRFERYAFLRGRSYTTGIAFQEREGGYAGAEHNETFQAGDCYLRLERRGSRIYGSASPDGRNWKPLKPIDTVWPDRLKVGLTAVTTSSAPFIVQFEEFDLRTGGDQPPAMQPPERAAAPQPIAPPNSDPAPPPDDAPPPASNSPSPNSGGKSSNSPTSKPSSKATTSTPAPSESRSRTAWIVVIVICAVLLVGVVAGLGVVLWMISARDSSYPGAPRPGRSRRGR